MSEAKLVLKSETQRKTVVGVSGRTSIGGRNLAIIAGPCSVESREQMEEVSSALVSAPVQMIRGGVWKPRTSPYSFQGLGRDGLEILAGVRRDTGIPVITEVMSIEQLAAVRDYVDAIQIGSRNMQNFELLKAVGKERVPVMLKRGLSATIEEFLLAAEYIVSHGNPDVILCERGIRSFDTFTRNVLDLGAVVALKQLSHLPVIVDPSHATGKRELVADLARAAVACGADGLMIECHPQPERSVSDARQAISLEDMVELISSLRPIAAAVGRSIEPSAVAPAPVVSIDHLRMHAPAMKTAR